MKITVINQDRKYLKLIKYITEKYQFFDTVQDIMRTFHLDKEFLKISEKANCMPCITENDTIIKMLDSTFCNVIFIIE